MQRSSQKSEKSILILASVASMIDQFNMDNIKILLELGYRVEVACNFERGNTCSAERIDDLKRRLEEKGVKFYQVDFTRNVLNLIEDLKAYNQVKKIVKQNKYNLIHCHSPIGGVIGRIVAHEMKIKVIYTAHGFHFYKGSPLKNWCIYYPVEKICSYMTDVLITINREDFALAKRKMKAKSILYVPGVGVDTKRFDSGITCKNVRGELGIPEEATMLLSIGELNENKNHESVIRALANMERTETGDIYYVIVGKGNLQDKLRQIAVESCLEKNIILTGFRTDVIDFYHSADFFVFPSYREGLSVALMEAMASGLPVAASNIRGNCDLIDPQGGNLFNPYDVSDIEKKLLKLLNLPNIELKKMSEHNKEKIKKFSRDIVKKAMTEIYRSI